MIYLFSDKGATVSQVGGKGYSLIRMSQGGFNVPPGMVLSVEYFREWLDRLESIPELRMNRDDTDEALKRKIEGLRGEAAKQVLSEAQKTLLQEKLAALGPIPLFSARSSSPEEDMEGASFAGMYETILGVKPDGLEESIRRVFLSCIDFRVVAYKRKNGFDFTKYSIAVVVMAQIKSEVAGVAFSVNPLNNCYDEIVINSNFGVGESVVSGDTVPDEFTVDKYSKKIIGRKIGGKQVAIIIGDDGGTRTISENAGTRVTLEDERILELTTQVKKIEEYYGMPMDIEWALAGGVLYMLQARPITTLIPLHPSFVTEPGKKRTLYLDLTLVEQGIQKPLSVLGTDCFRLLTNYMGISAAGIPIAEKPGDLVYAAGGRAYVNLSKEVLLEGQKMMAGDYEGLDTYAAQTIRDADMKEYKGHVTASGAWVATKTMIKGVWKSRDMIKEILSGMKHPEKLREFIDEKGAEYMKGIDELDSKEHTFGGFACEAMRRAADLMIHVTIPSLVDGQMAKGAIAKMFGKKIDEEIRQLADKLDRGLPYNVTIDMSCRIWDMMKLLDKKEFDDIERLERKLSSRELPAPFLEKWDEFIVRYGFRGPREVDIKTPRYKDKPSILLRQMQSYLKVAEADSPPAIVKRQEKEREEAFASLTEKVKDRKKLEKYYGILINLGGYREIHKYYMVYAGEKIRRRAIRIGEDLVKNGRLDAVDDIFYLAVEEIQNALDDRTLDVRKKTAESKIYMKKVERIDNFPPIIDSRGKILRPDRKEPAPGELLGDPVSAGIVKGKAKIINFVGEKEIYQGEILVAKGADPGWTPLFINAAGILLEVGGMLQHGSLIAREYGKPCIAGIEKLTQTLKDGDMIEMNGATGMVKKLSCCQ